MVMKWGWIGLDGVGLDCLVRKEESAVRVGVRVSVSAGVSASE